MVAWAAALTVAALSNILEFPGYSIAGMVPCFERPDLGREPGVTNMPNRAAELGAVQHLASLCAFNITNIRDAKAALGPLERGLDVVFDLDGRRIGAQHTIFHADEGQTAGKRGSLARAKEEATARATQAPFCVGGIADYRPALARRLQEKCAIAAPRHP
jgi:hypothetical protein